MRQTKLYCKGEQRREQVRRHRLNGLDYVEVSPTQTELTVYFLGKAPQEIRKENLRIEGGRRITGIQVTKDPEIYRAPEPDHDDYMTVAVDKSGDFSIYTLRVVERGGAAPLEGFDPRYSSVKFSFKVDCPSDLDCKQDTACLPEPVAVPQINYLAKDYASFRQAMLDRLAVTMPEWRERHEADIGIALVEAMAYVGDHLSYYQDAVATEAYLTTARQRISVRRHARLVDYRLHEGCNARVWVYVETQAPYTLVKGEGFFTTRLPNPLLAGRAVVSVRDLEEHGVDPAGYEVFEPLPEKIALEPDHNEIEIYTWGDEECCLPKGSTRTTLKGRLTPPRGDEQNTSAVSERTAEGETELRIQAGDYLLFQERLGPKTGLEADADPARRHVVRLTKVTAGQDELFNQPVVEVAWGEADALPFPLCISAVAGPDCQFTTKISVARGNIVPADHGRHVAGLDPAAVGTKPAEQTCEEKNRRTGVSPEPEPYYPALTASPLTFASAFDASLAASRLLDQDPREATASLDLSSALGGVWTVRPDLFASESTDADLVVESDDAGVAHLRFGDGELGAQPQPGDVFTAVYRAGNGPAGNVGAGTIVHIVFRGLVSGVDLKPWNPLPARGGQAAEPVAEAKLFAPRAFRKELKRAITPEDYATLAQAPYFPKVQRAAAEFRWSGSWYEVMVAIDPLASVSDPEIPDLIRDVERRLFRVRRIGHDLRVVRARYIPLEVEVDVCVEPDYSRGHVKAALLDVLGSRILRDGRRGFFHPDNLTFGQSIAVSRIVATAQAVEGVASVSVAVLKRRFEPAGDALETGLLRMRAWEIPRLDNDPSFPENGSLKINTGGGR